MRKLLAILMVMMVALSAIAVAVPPPSAPSSSPAASAAKPGSSSVEDLSKLKPEEKEKFYKNPDLRKSQTLPNGFKLDEFFQFNPGKDALVLDGPPRLLLAKGSYDGSFNGKTFDLTIKGAEVGSITAGEQDFNNIPTGSRVTWDGKRLSVILPDKNRIQLTEEKDKPNTVIFSKDEKTGALIIQGDFKSTAVIGDTAIKGKVQINTKEGSINGEKGTTITDKRIGQVEFTEKGAVTINEKEFKFDGSSFRLDTKEGRRLAVSGTGAYDPAGQLFSFSKNGKVADLELGITGAQQDQSKPFSVSLKDTSLTGNGIVIATRTESQPGKPKPLTESQIDKFGDDLIAKSDLPAQIKSALVEANEAGKGKTQIEKDFIRAAKLSSMSNNPKWGEAFLALSTPFIGSIENALKVEGLTTQEKEWLKRINDLKTIKDSGVINVFKEGLKKGDAATEVFDGLSKHQKDAILKISPNLNDFLKKFAPQTSSSREVAVLKLFGDAQGSYLNAKNEEIAFSSALKLEARPGSRTIPIELSSFDAAGKPRGELVQIAGTGPKLKAKPVEILSLSYVDWKAGKPSTPSVNHEPPRGKGMDPQEWAKTDKGRKYSKEALELIKGTDYEEYADMFDKDGNPNVERIEQFQNAIGAPADGKIGGGETIPALKEKLGVDRNPATKPHEKKENDDSKAQKATAPTEFENALQRRVDALWNAWEDGNPESEKQWDAAVRELKEKYKGLEIDAETGEILKFPPRESSLGKRVSSAVADYLADPSKRKGLDELAAILGGDAERSDAAKAARAAARIGLPGDARKAELLSAMTGSSELEESDVKLIQSFAKLAGSKEGAAMLEKLRKEGKLGEIAKQMSGSGPGFFEKLKTLGRKIDAGIPLSGPERELLAMARDKPSLEMMKRANSAGLLPDKMIQKVQKLQLLEDSVFQRDNPMGVLSLQRTLERNNLDFDDLPQGFTVAQSARAGLLMNSQRQSASGSGLIWLTHLGLDRGETIVVQSKDGIGAVAVTRQSDGTVSFEDVKRMSDYSGFDKIRVNFAALVPPGEAKQIASIPIPELRNGLIKTTLGALGDNPFDAKEFISGQVQGAKGRAAGVGTPVAFDVRKLYDSGDLDISGIKRQGVRKFFGSKNEIDATKTLLPTQLMSLFDSNNMDSERVIKVLRKKYTLRDIDDQVRQFGDEYRRYKQGR